MYSIRRNVWNELRNNYSVQNLIAIAIKIVNYLSAATEIASLSTGFGVYGISL